LWRNRQIGMAIGVLMAHHKITEDDAFALLRVASQALHRKLPDIAAEVTERGILPELPCRSANTRPVPVDQG
jgi:AmiR/NasT family two-component response regulator